MAFQKKPYLIIPFLVEQPTWGGTYICEKKGWSNRPELKGKKFGQSYELYDRSMLALAITSSDDLAPTFQEKDTVSIVQFQEERAFPLIKLTQAKGNSFQLHVKPEVVDARWKQKAESWYYLEKGKITFGLKKGVDIAAYKTTCIAIEQFMKELVKKIQNKTLSKQQAEGEARRFITEKNPWQFVNVFSLEKGDIVDLSSGGLHHSWEEDSNNPLGNIVYEVQQDVMDPTCTIRSFDQGKFKEDGTIREIHIEDYFKYIDSDEKRNTLITKKSTNGILFDTPHYSLSLLTPKTNIKMQTTSSFHHLFIKEGRIEVISKEGDTLTVGVGHSCFIPRGLSYTIKPVVQSELLQTFLR